jgi:hypothetical protein
MGAWKHWRDPATGVEYTLNRTGGGSWVVLSVNHDPRPTKRVGLVNKRTIGPEPPPLSPGSAVYGVPDDET